MSKCPLCGSDGDDLVFRFYCQNRECANFVPSKMQEKRLAPVSRFPVRQDIEFMFTMETKDPPFCKLCGGPVRLNYGNMCKACASADPPYLIGRVFLDRALEVELAQQPEGEVFSFSQPEFVGKFPKVDSPLFRIASVEKRPLPMPLPSRIFSMPFNYEAEWLDTDRDLEVMKEHIYAGLGVPREFLEPGCGSRPGKDFPHFKLVLNPFDNSLMLYWYDQVPAVLNTLIHPILENRAGTPMTNRLEGTTQRQIIERLLDMVRKGQLVRNETRYRWELHFTE